MATAKLVVWNLEWINKLFVGKDEGPALKPDDALPEKTSKHTVGERLELIAKGLKVVDPDILVVVEGPDFKEEFPIFIDRVAEGTWEVMLQESLSVNSPRPGETQVYRASQCIGIAVRTDRGKFSADPLRVFDALDENEPIHHASNPFFFDTRDDKVLEWYRYERRPAYAEITLANGAAFRVIGLHLKSKGIFDAYEWSRWWQIADANRERLLAQCRQFREAFLDDYLTAPATRDIPLIVCGDINDGPGFDTSEMRLNASGIETLMGSVWRPELSLGNALYDRLEEKKKARLDFRDNFTTSFRDPIFENTFHRVWIDHILYSRGQGRWVREAEVTRGAEIDGEDFPFWQISDHYPVSATIALSDPPTR